MAHFAELNENNVVIRVVAACNQDIAKNGGEQSDEAAEHFKTTCPLSNEGVKWIQTSYNGNFRKQYAGKGMTYDEVKDKFLVNQPYPSWVLDVNDDWEAPVLYPNNMLFNGVEAAFNVYWNESLLRWEAKDFDNLSYAWDSSLLNWYKL